MYSFFFNDTATTEIYTLSLHDALPICRVDILSGLSVPFLFASRASHAARSTLTESPTERRVRPPCGNRWADPRPSDRKSTRLNSSHLVISYAVFCLKKKNTTARV